MRRIQSDIVKLFQTTKVTKIHYHVPECVYFSSIKLEECQKKLTSKIRYHCIRSVRQKHCKGNYYDNITTINPQRETYDNLLNYRGHVHSNLPLLF